MKINRRKLVLNSSMAMLLISLIALIYLDKESKIADFPVPMSAIHINDDKEEDYKYKCNAYYKGKWMGELRGKRAYC